MQLRYVRFVACLYPVCFSLASFAEGDCKDIKLWTRRAGDYSGSADNSPVREVSFPLTGDGFKVKGLWDLQYGGKRAFKEIALEDVISGYKSESRTDLILLHFQNKMIIPLSLDDASSYKGKIVLANSIKVDGKWTAEFPIVERKDPGLKDPRPIRFCGNKIVVSEPQSFLLAGQKTSPKIFTPWRYVDSLTGIEFADKTAYYAQFDVGKSPQSEEGFQVFKNRCQYCHGAQRVGADLGWDYAGPRPAFEKRPAASLYLHVKYEKAESFRLGTIMPPQPDIQEHEATVLWQWLKDVAKIKLHPYRP